jgi:hypothetical protein
MSDSEQQCTFEQLPPEVRGDFERMKLWLGSELTIRNPRRIKGGWIVGIYTLDGVYGGDYMAIDPPPDDPKRRPPWERR